MSAKKKEETNNLLKSISNIEESLDLLRLEYTENPSNPLYSIIIAQELSLKEMKNLYTNFI
jgi:hypothetical protein